MTCFDRRLLVAMGLVATLAAPSASAQLYKWVDEKGVTQYGDKLPPEYAGKASSQLSKQGVTLKKNEAAVSADAQRGRDEDAPPSKEVLRAQEEQRRKDAALLASYANEQEIDLLKNRSVKNLEIAITSSQAQIAELSRKKAKSEAEKATHANKPVPEAITREIIALDSEIARHNTLIDGKRKEIAQVSARYDADKARFRELKIRQADADSKAASTAAAAPSHPGARKVISQ